MWIIEAVWQRSLGTAGCTKVAKANGGSILDQPMRCSTSTFYEELLISNEPLEPQPGELKPKRRAQPFHPPLASSSRATDGLSKLQQRSHRMIQKLQDKLRAMHPGPPQASASDPKSVHRMAANPPPKHDLRWLSKPGFG